jgi:alpha-glucosidase
MDFLRKIPTVWDDTKVLAGEVGEHITIARRSGQEWYVGALTDESGRDVTIDLGFLGDGAWTMTLWKDAPDSEIDAQRIATETRDVNVGDRVTVRLTAAGGAVAHFVKR